MGTQWGKTALAHLTNIAAHNVCQELLTARNPKGNTHEDIDAKFKIIRDKLSKVTMLTVQDLEAAIWSAFPGKMHGGAGGIPVVLVHVDATWDYIKHYEQAIDPELANFSYSSHTTGYHAYKVENDGARASHVIARTHLFF